MRADRVRPELKGSMGAETLGREWRHSAEPIGLRPEVRGATGAETLGRERRHWVECRGHSEEERGGDFLRVALGHHVVDVSFDLVRSLEAERFTGYFKGFA